MAAVVRTILYFLAMGVLWFVEWYVFTTVFGLSLPQRIAMAVYFFCALCVAGVWLWQSRDTVIQAGVDPSERPAALVPGMALLLGSFIALPVFMLVLIAGAVL
jgi:hypothetical protein